MLITGILTKLVGIGCILALVSLGGRPWHIELSRRMTGIALALAGFSLTALCVIAKPLMESVWTELEILLRFFAGSIGLLAGIWGLWRIKKHSLSYTRAEADFLREHLGGDPPILQKNATVSSQKNNNLYVKGWAFTHAGLLIYLSIILTPGMEEQTLDGSPESLVLGALILAGGIFLVIGRTLLERHKKAQTDKS